MSKEKMFECLDEHLSNCNVEQKVDFLHGTLKTWLEEYEKKILENKIYCFHCKKFHRVLDFQVLERVVDVTDHYHGEIIDAKKEVKDIVCKKCGGVIAREIIRLVSCEWR